MLAAATFHMPLNPFAKEWVPSQPNFIPPSPPTSNAGFVAPLLPPGLPQPTNGHPPSVYSEPFQETGLAHQISLTDLQFEDVLFNNAHAGALEPPSNCTTPPLTPRHSEELVLPPGIALTPRPGDGPATPEPVVLSSHVICSPRVPSPRRQRGSEGSECDIFETQPVDEPRAPQSLVPSALDDKVGPSSFELLRVVGQGAFGKVFQVRKKDSGQVYAMKVMRKERILEKDHCDYVKAERDVLTSIVHPYIVTLRYSFQTSSKLYLVLDFINGGHLFFQLYRQGIFTEELARLYTAEIVLAIAHLHSVGFVHRDLKPENVLLDSEGHIKVTDFGLAKANITDDIRTNSFIGTMEYMAPEIISGKGHGKSADWWSVGILLYEMLCGVPPFRAKGRAALQKQIMASKIKYPPYLSTDTAHLLKSLLQREVPKRLGFGEKGSEHVMKHPFFKPINWDRLMNHQVASPFKPNVKHVDSVENFDKMWTDQKPVDSPCGTPRAGSDDLRFAGFSYCAPSLAEALQGLNLQE